MNERRFKVRVHRYLGDEAGECGVYAGSFVSDVYEIRGNSFLVYDDGECSASLEPNQYGFMWVDFTEVIPGGGDPECSFLKVELFDCEDI